MFSCSRVRLCLTVVIVVFSSLMAAFSIAEENKMSGILDDISFERSTLVIDDRVFKMALNFKVYDLSGHKVNRYSLKLGQKLVYTFNDNPNGSKSITTAKISDKLISFANDED